MRRTLQKFVWVVAAVVAWRVVSDQLVERKKRSEDGWDYGVKPDATSVSEPASDEILDRAPDDRAYAVRVAVGHTPVTTINESTDDVTPTDAAPEDSAPDEPVALAPEDSAPDEPVVLAPEDSAPDEPVTTVTEVTMGESQAEAPALTIEPDPDEAPKPTEALALVPSTALDDVVEESPPVGLVAVPELVDDPEVVAPLANLAAVPSEAKPTAEPAISGGPRTLASSLAQVRPDGSVEEQKEQQEPASQSATESSISSLFDDEPRSSSSAITGLVAVEAAGAEPAKSEDSATSTMSIEPAASTPAALAAARSATISTAPIVAPEPASKRSKSLVRALVTVLLVLLAIAGVVGTIWAVMNPLDDLAWLPALGGVGVTLIAWIALLRVGRGRNGKSSQSNEDDESPATSDLLSRL